MAEEWIKAPDGHELYSLTWTPPSGKKIVATVVFTHGYGEHIARYQHVFSAFANTGIKTIGWDQRGFGQTLKRSRKTGHNYGYATVLSDAKFMSDRVRIAGVPHFVMGHSMGGGIALKFAVNYPNDIQGVIASAPLIKTGVKTSPSEFEYHAVVFAAKIFGTLALDKGVDPNALSRDPQVVKAFKEDPLISPYGSLTTLSSIIVAGRELKERDYAKITMPILMTFGTEDQLTCPLTGKQFMEMVPSTDKEYKEYPGFYHELHNEVGEDKDKVISYYIDWILKRSSA